MPDDGDRSSNNNPFIRFRHHVDANVHAGLDTVARFSRTSSTSPSADDTNPSPSTTAAPVPSSHHLPSPPDTQPYLPNTNNTELGMDATTNPPPTKSMLTPSESLLESRLDSLLSHHLPAPHPTPSAAHLAWHLFLTTSAYSPLRLERELPSRPVPLDLPSPSSSSSSPPYYHPAPPNLLPGYEHPSTTGSDCRGRRHLEPGWGYGRAEDGGLWRARQRRWNEGAWLDAFEDLMRASSGLEMVAVEELRERREREAGQTWFGAGVLGDVGLEVPAGVGGGLSGFGGMRMREVAWLGRMRSRGLTEVLFPVVGGEGYSSPRTMEEWVSRRRAEREMGRERQGRLEERVRMVEEVQRKMARDADAWEEARREMEHVRREMDGRDGGEAGLLGGFFGGIVKTLAKVLENELKALENHGKDGDESERMNQAAAEKNEKKEGNAPETESDLYSFVQSAFHESERSLSNLFKFISDGLRHDNDSSSVREPKPASPPKVEITEEPAGDGLVKKTTKTEFVDDHGNTHAKTETVWTDEHGKVVMRSVQSSSGKTYRWEKRFEHGRPAKEEGKEETEAVNDKERQQQQRQQEKLGGWFWK